MRALTISVRRSFMFVNVCCVPVMVLVRLNVTLGVPKNAVIVWAVEFVHEPGAAGYAGGAGVGVVHEPAAAGCWGGGGGGASGSPVVSAVSAALPPPKRIAVDGRQNE